MKVHRCGDLKGGCLTRPCRISSLAYGWPLVVCRRWNERLGWNPNILPSPYSRHPLRITLQSRWMCRARKAGRLGWDPIIHTPPSCRPSPWCTLHNRWVGHAWKVMPLDCETSGETLQWHRPISHPHLIFMKMDPTDQSPREQVVERSYFVGQNQRGHFRYFFSNTLDSDWQEWH